MWYIEYTVSLYVYNNKRRSHDSHEKSKLFVNGHKMEKKKKKKKQPLFF